MKRQLKIYIVFILIFSASKSYSQFYNGLQMTFGKNRVQWSDEKIWSYFRFDKFDTYFYQNGRELAINTAKYAEIIIPELEKKIEYYLDSKIQFLIFNSMSDMRESNLGLADEDQYNIGGVTQVIGRTVIIYFDGNYVNFERQIRKGIATILVNQMLYGDEIGANIKNSALLFLPDWFIFGLISYIADDWTIEIDNIARNGFLNGRFLKFNNLNGKEAEVAGHSIWKYVHDKYGDQSVPNIVYMTKISRSVENGFLYFLGMSFKNLSKEWYAYNYSQYSTDIQDRMPFPSDTEIKIKTKSEAIVSQFIVNPDGNSFAYVTDYLTKKTIYIQDITTGKRKRIFKTGHKIDEAQDLSYPLMAWHPSGKLLAFIVEKKGLIHLYYYLTETRSLERQSVFGVDKIHDISYSPNGLSLLVSATINGQSDIFVYQLASKTFEPITKDIYDDVDPCFVYNGKYIAFASNRTSDTIVFSKDTYLRDYGETVERSPSFNIFLYNYQSKSPVLWRVTDLPTGNATQPIPLEKNRIQFLCDENGITNRYVAEIDSAISHVDTVIHYRYFSTIHPVTDYMMNIEEHQVHSMGDMVSEIIYHNNSYHLYTLPRIPLTGNSEVINQNTAYANELSYAKSITTFTLDTIEQKQSYPAQPTDTGQVDINNYVFRFSRKSSDTTSASSKVIEPKTDTLKDNFILPNQRNYDVEYSINQLVNQLDYSFLNYSYQQFSGPGPIFLGPGINAFFKAGINDLLENYRMIGGIRFALDFRNNEYFFGFENYKSRLDQKLIFHRQSYEQFTPESYIRHKQHDLHYILQYPFSNVLALRTSFMLRQNLSYYLSIDYPNLIKPNESVYWGGAKAELVFDNTRNPQLNIYYGQRFKFWGEYFQLIDKKQQNLVVLGFDYRHYTRIHRNFIWANRFAASSSMGNSKLIYYLGGVDNWLFPKFNYDINISYDKNYVYQALATNMRGFEQNIRNGNSFCAINSELRMPVFRYFFNRPLRSEFLNNFQVVAFGDIGTAWEGFNPFSEDNSLFTHVVTQKPLTVIVKRQKNPIVGGFGPGLRTKVLGYFLRTDLAWGVEDGKMHKPVFYISLSLDF